MANDTLKEVRRVNLRRWIDEDPHARGNVSKWCDHYSVFLRDDEKPFNPNHIRQYVPKAGGKAHASIGEDLARKIERATGRPKYSLDAAGSTRRSFETTDGPLRQQAEEQRIVAALKDAPAYQKAVIEMILGLTSDDDLPDGAGDAIRLGLKLASSGSRGPKPERNAA